MAATYGAETESSVGVVEMDEELGAEVEYSTGFEKWLDETDAGAEETTLSEVTAAGGVDETRPKGVDLLLGQDLKHSLQSNELL